MDSSKGAADGEKEAVCNSGLPSVLECFFVVSEAEQLLVTMLGGVRLIYIYIHDWRNFSE